jgi:hypothetical protein
MQVFAGNLLVGARARNLASGKPSRSSRPIKYRNRYLLGAFFFANVTLGGSCAIQDKQTATLPAGASPPQRKKLCKKEMPCPQGVALQPTRLFGKKRGKKLN